MTLKRTTRLRIDQHGNWIQYSGVFMELFLFARAVYFFACRELTAMPAGELWLQMIIPMALAMGYLIVARGIQLTESLPYGGFTIGFCLLLIVLNLQQGRALGTILIVILYLLSAVISGLTFLGYLQNRWYLLSAFATTALVQFLVSDIWSRLIYLQVGLLIRDSGYVFCAISLALLVPALVSDEKKG